MLQKLDCKLDIEKLFTSLFLLQEKSEFYVKFIFH